MKNAVDEEALAAHRASDERALHGAYFTPAWLVERVLDAVAPWCPASGPSVVVDPACGAGAFLAAAAQRFPAARLVGVELDEGSAATARARLPGRGVIVTGNALTGDVLAGALGASGSGFELWVGNPPWNGTSPLLSDKPAWERLHALLPPGVALKRRTSLRDDFVFFLLLAAARLEARPGALAFVTPASLLDAYAHAPIREGLLQRLALREVLELPGGTFRNTLVAPCVSVWTSPRTGASSSTFSRVTPPTEGDSPGSAARERFSPRAPHLRLRPVPGEVADLDARWRRDGVGLSALVPVSFAGLKTRFDELLVDDERAALLERVEAFLTLRRPEEFAARFGLEAFLPKLEALKAFAAGAPFDARCARPFLRYRGPNPMGKPAWCYVDRRLIPRGDHRLRGDFDPHGARVKLVFNAHELPLAARVLDEPGCVTMYRHSRFAPLEVPAELRARPELLRPTGPLVPNLTPLGLEHARRLGSPRAVFEAIAAHVSSEPFQRLWAPTFGAAEEPLIALPQT